MRASEMVSTTSRRLATVVAMAMMMGTSVGGVNLYPSKLDAASLLLNNANRIAVETSEIYDDLSGK